MGLSKNCVFATSIIFYTLPVVSGQLISRIISNGSEFTVKKYYHADKPTPSNSQKFIIATCSYNNKDWYERNLAATFNQNYDNYELFYVDDCSPDGTSDLVEQYITEKQANCDITLIKNKKRVTALLNLYRIIHMAKPNDIIIILDGDDWLPHDNILSFLNQIYLDKNIWFTYGQFKTYPYGDIGFCKPYPEYIIQNNSFREYDYQPSHLRTFYAWLAQQIKLEDMLYAGQFYKMTYDLALTMPMIEMTSRRHKFIPDITCIYNDATPSVITKPFLAFSLHWPK